MMDFESKQEEESFMSACKTICEHLIKAEKSARAIGGELGLYEAHFETNLGIFSITCKRVQQSKAPFPCGVSPN